MSAGGESRAERVRFVAAVVAMATALIAIAVEHYWLRALKFDDAWIHYRYAVNVAAGAGFVYNPGERVLGSGGVLWDLLLAAVARVVGPAALPDAVSVVNWLALVACGAVLYLVLRRLVVPWLAVALATALFLHGPLLVSSIGGMETSVLCLLYFLALLALMRERPVAAGLAAGLAVCIRLESMALVAAVLLAALPLRRRRIAPVVLASLAAPIAGWLWAWAYFGGPLATSTSAKRLVYVVPPFHALYASLGALLDVLPFHRVLPLAGSYPLAAHWLGIAVWALLCARGYRLLRRASAPASLVAIQVLAALGFYALTNPQLFVWYQCTFVPLATLFALLGLVDVVRRTPGLAAFPNGMALALVIGLSVLPLRDFWMPLVPPDDPRFSVRAPNAREHARTYQYANIARWLNERAQPSDRVCISEIGSFGFHYRGPILDGLGLVSPEVLRYHPLSLERRRSGLTGAIPPEVVRQFGPEWVVSLDVFAEALFADPWFAEHYELVGRWPWFGGPARWHDLSTSVLGGSEMRAYRRRDPPRASGEGRDRACGVDVHARGARDVA